MTTVDTEGRVGVLRRARWPFMAVAWIVAVTLTTLLTWRVIHVVSHQLTSPVSLPRPTAASPVVVVPAPTAPTTPTARSRGGATSAPSPEKPTVVDSGSNSNVPPPVTVTDHPGGSTGGHPQPRRTPG